MQQFAAWQCSLSWFATTANPARARWSATLKTFRGWAVERLHHAYRPLSKVNELGLVFKSTRDMNSVGGKCCEARRHQELC